jgi:LmbE family N-acetylglucosaminyl deacetylase
MGLDALFFGAHPDDVELTSGGLAALLASLGHTVGIADPTRGERASRGTPEERAREAGNAAKALGVAKRVSLSLPDLGLDRTNATQLASVVALLRAERPRLVVAPDRDDPHPDHIEGSHLVARACYLSGLVRFDAPGEPVVDPDPVAVCALSGGARTRGGRKELRWSAASRHSLRTSARLDPCARSRPYLTHPDFLAEVEGVRAPGAPRSARFGEGLSRSRPDRVADARAARRDDGRGGTMSARRPGSGRRPRRAGRRPRSGRRAACAGSGSRVLFALWWQRRGRD